MTVNLYGTMPARPFARILNGTTEDDILMGGGGSELIRGFAGDDIILAGGGNDRVTGGMGNDTVRAGKGNDTVFGCTGNDILAGEKGHDVLFGDAGLLVARGLDLGADVLSGGAGNDVLWAGDGLDQLTGGAGADTFAFKYSNPQTLQALPPLIGAFALVTDFNAGQGDRFAFDAVGVGTDGASANFVNGAATSAGGAAATFYAGAAAGSNGEAVMVLTDQGFATGGAAVMAAQGEAAGDLILYFNTTVNQASILFVTGENAAGSFARIGNITTLEALQGQSLTADDFVFV